MSKVVQLVVRQRCESVIDSAGVDSKYRVITLIDSAQILDTDTHATRVIPEMKYMFLLQHTGDTSSATTGVATQYVSQSIFKRIANPEDFKINDEDTATLVDDLTWQTIYTNGYVATYGGEQFPEQSLSPDRNHVTTNKYYISYVLVKEFTDSDDVVALGNAQKHATDILLSLSTFKERYNAQIVIYDNTASETEIDI